MRMRESAPLSGSPGRSWPATPTRAMVTARRCASATARRSMRACRIAPRVAPMATMTSRLTTPNACSSVGRGRRNRILPGRSAAERGALSAVGAAADACAARDCGRRPSRIACPPMLLEGRKLLVTGVLTDKSIAYFVARRAQEEGAEVVLTGFGRGLRITERMAKRLPTQADVLELDVNDPEQLEAVAKALDERWGRLDGVLHAIAFVPGDALGGQFLTTPSASAIAAFETSAFSMKALAAALLPLLERGESPGVVGMDFDASVAWPAYDWAGVSKAALESISRYLARDLGPRGVRSNLVAAGPLQTVAASNIEGFEGLAQVWERQAPLGWDLSDPTPVADACLFLLSTLARAITGEILHVDGGVHALGAAMPDGAGAAAEPEPAADAAGE